MTDASLQVLARQLTRGEEKPDILARRQILDDLVDNELSKWELRYLRDRLNAVPLTLDIFMALHDELLINIIAILDLEDFMTARGVSRAWRRKFSSPFVSLAMMKQHFRYTWETSYNSLSGPDRNLAKVSLCNTLPTAVTKRLWREHYKCRSWRSSWVDTYPDLADCSSVEEPQYSSGAIAWQVRETRAITIMTVDGRFGDHRVVREPNRTGFKCWILADQYLFASYSATSPSLGAWDREGNGIAQVRLPSLPCGLSAYGSRVGIITANHEALVWNVGGPLLLLDTSAGCARLGEVTKQYVSHILFSPTDNDILFVVHNAWLNPSFDMTASHFKLKLAIDVFVKGRYCYSHYSERNYPSPVLRIPSRMGLNEADADDFIKFPSGPSSLSRCSFASNAIVSKDGICSFWWRLQDEIDFTDEPIIFEEFDLYEAQLYPSDGSLLTRPHNQPDFPSRSEGQMTIHGQEVIAHPYRWMDRAVQETSSNLGRTFYAQADENLIVVFGTEAIAVGTF